MAVIADRQRISTFRRLFTWYDRLWRRLHGVQRLDELLSMSITQYRGPRRTLSDGVCLERGDWLGILHFNHDFFVNPTARERAGKHGAFRFRRQLIRSLIHLARRMEVEAELGRIKAFHGVNWFRPHGDEMGFIIERLPDGFRTRLRILHFRLLLLAFFPDLASQQRGRLYPHAYWLTQRQLMMRFGPSRDMRP